MMSSQEEHEVAVKFAQTSAPSLGARLVTANLRLVVTIASEFRGSRSQILDLIQEGNLGLVQAVNKYDPLRLVKLGSYAAWWIRAYILKFCMANASLVKLGTTKTQRLLFFNLGKTKEVLEKQGLDVDARRIAATLGVRERDVTEMQQRLGGPDLSLDPPAFTDRPLPGPLNALALAAPSLRPDARLEIHELHFAVKRAARRFAGTLPDRDRDIFRERFLEEDTTTRLALADRFGVSSERIRQIESELTEGLQSQFRRGLGTIEAMADLMD